MSVRMEYKTISLKEGMPTVDKAVSLLHQEIRNGKSSKKKIIKIIHGYGSSGTGGKIKRAIHKELTAMISDKTITGFIKGEDFSIFDEASRKARTLCPSLGRDSDYGNSNSGITIVVL